MIATDTTEPQLNAALTQASETYYGGNLRWKQRPAWLGYGYRFTIRVRKSDGPGAARSTHGRKLISACWHAHRDLIAALFEQAPDAVVSTTLVKYEGKADFEVKFPKTGDGIVGSLAKPLARRDACDCDE